MDSASFIGLGILALMVMSFLFNQLNFREIKTKNQQNMNGISHVWGMLMELKSDLKQLEEE